MNYAQLDIQQVKQGVKQLEDASRILLRDLFEGKTKQYLRNQAGIYAFWWVGDEKMLINQLYKSDYKLKGPHLRSAEIDLIHVNFNSEWISASKRDNAICLYVGKSTKIRQRVNGHIRRKVDDIWRKLPDEQVFGYGKKPNTVSQLRIGVERIFKNHSLELILENIAISWIPLSDSDAKNNAINRFFIEDKLIGEYYPLFNIDVER